jgi:hypothetical protein
MMLDNFKEDVVCRRNQLLPSIMYMICWVFVVMLALYASLMLQVMFMQFSIMSILLFAASAALAVLLFFKKDDFKVEYEYIFTNGTLDFAKVLRGARRKELGSMNVANVSACGHVAHQSFHKFLAQKDVDKKNWFLNRDGNLFYFYYVKENKKHMIIIEPSEEMVSMIRKYVAVGAYQG